MLSSLGHRSTPPPMPTAALDLSRMDWSHDGAPGFTLDTSAPGAVRVAFGSDQRPALVSRASGTVKSVAAGLLVLESGAAEARVHHTLPVAIGLGPLRGFVVDIVVAREADVYGGVTSDAALFDASGALLLWARDGALPRDHLGLGVSVRVAHELGEAPRLVLASSGTLMAASAGQAAEWRVGKVQYHLLAMRVSSDRSAFILVRR